MTMAMTSSLTIRAIPFTDSLSSTTSTTKNRPSFLSLPAELRNTIYRFLLVSPYLPVLRRLCARNHCSTYILPPLPICPKVLATCRQIHHEAMPILYAENIFTAHASLLTSMPYLIDPTRPICSPNAIRWIRKWYLTVRLDTDARYSSEMVEKAFSGAEELEIETNEAMFRASGHGVLYVFKGVRGVGRVKIAGNAEQSVYRWLEECMMAPLGTYMEDYEAWKVGRGRDIFEAEKDVKRLYPRMGPEYDPWLDGNR